VDRSYVFLLSTDGRRVTNSHEWRAEGAPPILPKGTRLGIEDVSCFTDTIFDKKTINVPRVKDLGPEFALQKSILDTFNIKSIVLVPMLSKGSVRGFIGIDSVDGEREWPAEITGLLSIVADMFSNALDRKRTEEALRESEKKFRELAELLPAFVNETDLTGKFTFVNKAALDSTGYTWDEFWAGINALTS
jgi:PAS domain-containing protein